MCAGHSGDAGRLQHLRVAASVTTNAWRHSGDGSSATVSPGLKSGAGLGALKRHLRNAPERTRGGRRRSHNLRPRQVEFLVLPPTKIDHLRRPRSPLVCVLLLGSALARWQLRWVRARVASMLSSNMPRCLVWGVGPPMASTATTPHRPVGMGLTSTRSASSKDPTRHCSANVAPHHRHHHRPA